MIPIAASAELEALSELGDLLREILLTQRLILAKLAQSTDSRSSVEVKTSARGVDIAAKSYADSDVLAQVGPAVLAYFEAMGRVQKCVDDGVLP